MKRTDLVAGEIYEHTKTRDKTWTDKIMVLDDKPWRDRNSGYVWGYYRGADRYRQDGHARGVAVARKSGDQWIPDVVNLQQIVPLGTSAAANAQRDAAQQVERDARNAQRAETNAIAMKLGLHSYEVRRDGRYVRLPMSALTELLAQVEQAQ